MSTADWIQLAVGAVLFVTLLAVFWYAWETRNMVKEIREQRYDSVRPVIDIKWLGEEPTPFEMPDPGAQERMAVGLAAKEGNLPPGLQCALNNVGLGPAIDVHSFILGWNNERRQNERRQCDFGTIAQGQVTKYMTFSLEQKDDKKALVVFYKDVYGRLFESSREVSLNTQNKNLDIGPLKIRAIPQSHTTQQ